MKGASPLFLVLALSAACSRPPGIFSEQNARVHVGMLAGTIGTRPAGTPPNAVARTYIVDQLKQIGFEVRVQETDARRRDLGRSARVSNIIGILPGPRREAIGLLSHYDSAPEAPGAADDALGVAVSLETARIVAARADRTWSLMVLVTDAEESGLMGAAALIGERDITDRLKTFINVEAIGSAGVPVLFETGPGNGWLTAAWAKNAPHPRGGSYGMEVYKRLPNDTDFTILKTEDIPGLNFAAVGDSYAYHTPRDTAERLSPWTIRTMGENAVAIVSALQRRDITERSPVDHTYFDVAGTVAVSYGPVVSTGIAGAALLLGALAWLRMMRTALRTGGILRWILMATWTAVAAAAVGAAMIGAVWLLRAAREVYHPWYAHPGRLLALLLTAGTMAAWAMARAGRLLPARAHGLRDPATTWSLTLPVWIALAAAALWFVPAAAYLWTVPLLSAGLVFVVIPPSRALAVRAASIAVLAVAGTLWLRESRELMLFMVAVMGRLPIITPAFLYPAVMFAAGVMVMPPLIGALAPPRALVRPSIVTAPLLLAMAVTAGLAYMAPAYTYDRPLRRHARAIQDAGANVAIWEVGSVEPGLDLGENAPAGFARVGDPPPVSVPWGRLAFPFVFRATGPSPGAPPAVVTTFTTSTLDEGAEASITVVPQVAGVIVSFVSPPGVVPARSNLPGQPRGGRWTATFVAPPADGVSWRASFAGASPALLEGIRVTATVPWGPRPPAWLPQERSVWSGGGTWVLSAPTVLASSEPLR
jgi:peptidase M28-like protein